ncbi:MAG TPA: hypothetical protein GX687_04575 [Clostridia bacterium]|nr:hypothetical protein [Clostridia bacterium]
MRLNLKNVPGEKIIALILLLIFLGGGFHLVREIRQPPPFEAVKQGLAYTLQASSFSFELQASRILKGETMILSEIQGQKAEEGVYVKGTLPLLNADLEIYYLGDQLYRRDTLTKDWVKIPAAGKIGVELLMAELNPLGVLEFLEEEFAAKYAGKAKVGKKKCRVYEVMSRGENKFAEFFWQDFNYILWVDQKGKYIRQAQITAEHRDEPEHDLQILITLGDFNRSFVLEPPVK